MGGNNANLLQDIRVSKDKLSQSSQAITQAITTFTTNSTEFCTLVEQLDSKFKELEEREAAVEKRENEVRDKTQQVQERECKCTEREQKVEEREKQVLEKETKWNETEKKMQQNAAKLPNVIRLDVSGTRFSIAKEKLLQQKGSLLEEIITSDHPPLTSTGEIFLDRDPVYFMQVIRYFLHGVVESPAESNLKQAIEREFSHFKIPFKFPDVFFSNRQTEANLVNDTKFGTQIREWIPGSKFQLLYKASVDGFSAENFHKWCDNKGSTLTVIQSNNGFLFGGYSVLPWDTTTNGYKQTPEGFIFTLTNPHNIPPTQYKRNSNTNAIYCGPNYGPSFGNGHDIYVAANPQVTGNASYANFPTSYSDTTGKGKATFTGAYNFVTSEIEVYAVILL